jgi:DNA topoisomerase VI subunit A
MNKLNFQLILKLKRTTFGMVPSIEGSIIGKIPIYFIISSNNNCNCISSLNQNLSE